MSTPNDGFNVIYADPPWQYWNTRTEYHKTRTGGCLPSWSAPHYPTLSLDEICTLPIEPLLAPSSVCFLWAPTPLLHDGLRVLSAWGFDYQTTLVWVKAAVDPFGQSHIQLGHDVLDAGDWFRPATAFLLVGSRGWVRPFYLAEPNILYARAAGHSAKPACVRRVIDRAVEGSVIDPRKLELFPRKPSRNPQDGWTCIGTAFEVRALGGALAADGGIGERIPA